VRELVSKHGTSIIILVTSPSIVVQCGGGVDLRVVVCGVVLVVSCVVVVLFLSCRVLCCFCCVFVGVTCYFLTYTHTGTYITSIY